MENPKTLNEELQKLTGQALNSVEFVADYVQLRFDGFTLTAYTPVDVVCGNEKTSLGNSKYRDLLCSQIHVQVRKATLLEGSGMTIVLENNTILGISLTDESYRGPEAIKLTSRDGSIWVA